MMKTSYYFSIFILFLLLGLCSFYLKNDIQGEISALDTGYSKKDSIGYNDVIVLKKNELSLEFKIPQADFCRIELYSTPNKFSYDKFLKSKDVSSIDAMRAANAYHHVHSKDDKFNSLIVSDYGHQLISFKENGMNDFHGVDSVESNLLFRYNILDIHFTEYKNGKKEMKEMSFKKFPYDTIYCIANMESKINNDWHHHGTIPFKIAMK